MEQLVRDFLSCKTLSSKDTITVLNKVALFNINDMYTFHQSNAGRLTVQGRDVYRAIHERFTVVAEYKTEDEYSCDYSYFVLQCNDTGQYFKFTFDYSSYGGYWYESGRWRKAQVQTKTITYYTDL